MFIKKRVVRFLKFLESTLFTSSVYNTLVSKYAESYFAQLINSLLPPWITEMEQNDGQVE